MSNLKHSYSSLKEFDNCAKRYHHTRILRDVKDEGNVASIHGSRIHKMLEDRLRDKAMLPAEAAKYEKFCVAVESLGGTLLLEHQMTLNSRLVPTQWESEDAWLRSILDVFVIDGDKAIIMDWKTGKRRPDFWQLELSVAQVFIAYPEVQSINTAFVWLKTGEFDSESYRRKDLQAILAKLAEKTNRIEEALEEDIWPARPSGLCSYCPAYSICSFAQKNWKRR